MSRRKTLSFFVPSNRTVEHGSRVGKPAPMDGMNEIVNQSRTNRFYAARREKENVLHVAWFARAAMKKARYAPMTVDDHQVCDVHICVHEVNRRRDVTNVYGGVLKYALDALTARNKSGVAAIWDDNSTWLRYLTPSIVVDPDNPGIEITVIPIYEKE